MSYIVEYLGINTPNESYQEHSTAWYQAVLRCTAHLKGETVTSRTDNKTFRYWDTIDGKPLGFVLKSHYTNTDMADIITSDELLDIDLETSLFDDEKWRNYVLAIQSLSKVLPPVNWVNQDQIGVYMTEDGDEFETWLHAMVYQLHTFLGGSYGH